MPDEVSNFLARENEKIWEDPWLIGNMDKKIASLLEIDKIEDKILIKSLNKATRSLKKVLITIDPVCLKIMVFLYKKDIDAHTHSESIYTTNSKLFNVMESANNLYAALDDLTKDNAYGALDLLTGFDGNTPNDMQLKLGPIVENPWDQDVPAFGIPEITMKERVYILSSIAHDHWEKFTSGRRNTWAAVHGSPLLSLMGKVVQLLNGKVSHVLPLARLLHCAVTTEQHESTEEWGKDEAARARTWWRQVAPWLNCIKESWPPEIRQVYERGPAAIPSPKQARNRRNGTIVKD